MWDVTHSTTIPQNFPQSSDLTGRSALVTGASRGIGEAIATELARRGASVVITSRKAEPLEEAAGRIRTAVPGATVSACAGNTGDADDRTAAVAAAVAQGGGIHILVNNTGIAPLAGPLMGADLAAYRKTFDTNVVAALGFVQEAYRAGMKDTGGSVVNISSVAGLRSTGVIAAYGTSKAALIRLTAELAWELGPAIRVNAIAPSVVRTKFASGLIEGENEARAANSYPMKRIGEPEDVARAVAFLASDESAWITGETLAVDGGMLATGGS
ncbi:MULTISPECIES: SDR family oxidoreductase [unclassified Gordonia (in: high G+C Gram-positive bacteria)]|uniref:SDR family oxidoreductase n=1 Tax=unclassified Gordonia (in: high G+C Gram-positive bacteria) TaxID=2657482 RepID=UPI0009911C9D|nr:MULTISPECIES: SDR family oxidoreductase [unclassified Gordonia (in: high G+C Gram-positive bacteria)]MCX2752630.1 SDR family oxidoreductase [Gordonia sp. 4N]MDT0222820.1 SDR family oxidoreductase [Gordonia sp. AC31]